MGKQMTIHEFVLYVEEMVDEDLISSFLDKIEMSENPEAAVAALFRTAFATAFVIDRLASGPASGVRFQSTDPAH